MLQTPIPGRRRTERRVAGATNIVSGFILRRQVWRKRKPDADR